MSCKDCACPTQGSTCSECDEPICDDCIVRPDPHDGYCKDCLDEEDWDEIQARARAN